jgi:hypothetical protein
VALFALAALSTRAADSSTQAPPPSATSPQTIPNKAELKKQEQAQAKAWKEEEKKAKAEAKEAGTQAKANKGKAGQTTTNAAAATKGATVQALEAPPLPISADKGQRLQELLKKYKADQLTPEQYQKERAKILAEP